MAKRNNDSQYYKDWTTKKLKDMAKSLDFTIYEVGCYGTRDLKTLEGVTRELQSRGVEIKKVMQFN